MKIATYNVENIFHRDEQLVKKNISQSMSDWMQELEDLLRKDMRQDDDYGRMRELSFLLGFHKSAVDPYVVMRRKAGQLFLQQREKCFDYRASELNSWNGWIKLATRPIPEIAVQNKAKVISEVNPDILVLQEVEDRHALLDFNSRYLPEEVRFTEVIVVQGNDPRSLDMGIMLKRGYSLENVTSHSNEYDEGGKLFDKDFQEYRVKNSKGDAIAIFSTHLCGMDKDRQISDGKRKDQSNRVAEVYQELSMRGFRKNVLLGTFNAPSYCDSISPILRGLEVTEVKKHKNFRVDIDAGLDASYHSLGAYRVGVNLKQKDYLMLSPDLFKSIKSAGLNRKGIWPEKKDQFRTYSSLSCESHQASSHPMVWVDLDL